MSNIVSIKEPRRLWLRKLSWKDIESQCFTIDYFPEKSKFGLNLRDHEYFPAKYVFIGRYFNNKIVPTIWDKFFSDHEIFRIPCFQERASIYNFVRLSRKKLFGEPLISLASGNENQLNEIARENGLRYDKEYVRPPLNGFIIQEDLIEKVRAVIGV